MARIPDNPRPQRKGSASARLDRPPGLAIAVGGRYALPVDRLAARSELLDRLALQAEVIDDLLAIVDLLAADRNRLARLCAELAVKLETGK